jgi:hypothetical protein
VNSHGIENRPEPQPAAPTPAPLNAGRRRYLLAVLGLGLLRPERAARSLAVELDRELVAEVEQ